eukprot:COSAG01_NODE_4031_length_5419_cov_8.013722_1_plen_1027_part_00
MVLLGVEAVPASDVAGHARVVGRALQATGNAPAVSNASSVAAADSRGWETQFMDWKAKLDSACDAGGHSITCVKRLEICASWVTDDDGSNGRCEAPTKGELCSEAAMIAGDCPGAVETCFLHEDEDGLVGMPYLLMALLLGCFVTSVLAKVSSQRFMGKKMSLQPSVVMFMTGLIVDQFFSMDAIQSALPVMHVSVQAWLSSHPHIILFVLLPPLLFLDSVSIDYHSFKKSLSSSLILAGPGVVLSTALTGLFSWALFYSSAECIAVNSTNTVAEETCNAVTLGSDQYCEEHVGCQRGRFTMPTHFLLGGILAATDPVAVLGVLKSLGAPEKLNQIIGGESLLNDGTAVVVFWIFRDMVADCQSGFFLVVGRFVVVAVGGGTFGWVSGHVCYLGLRGTRIPMVQTTILIACVFSVFWIAEHVLGVSGVLASVVFGLATSRKSYFAMNAESIEKNRIVWEQIGFMSTMILFMMAGIIVRGKINQMFKDSDGNGGGGGGTGSGALLGSGGLLQTELVEMLFKSVVVYTGVFVVRGCVIAVLFPILSRVGYGLQFKEAAVMTVGGLRGAVSLALALLVDAHPTIPSRVKDFVLIQTSAVVTLSLLINGSTVGHIYHRLNIYRINHFHRVLVRQAMMNLNTGVEKFVGIMKRDSFHMHASFDVVMFLFPNFKEACLVEDELVNIVFGNDSTVFQVEAAPWPAQLEANGADGASVGSSTGRTTFLDAFEDDMNAMGSSDPYTQVLIDRAGQPSTRKHTSKVMQTLNPNWNGTKNEFNFSVRSSETVVYAHVWDWNLSHEDDYLGQAKLDVSDLIEEGTRQQQVVYGSAEEISLTSATYLKGASVLETRVMAHDQEIHSQTNGPPPSRGTLVIRCTYHPNIRNKEHKHGKSRISVGFDFNKIGKLVVEIISASDLLALDSNSLVDNVLMRDSAADDGLNTMTKLLSGDSQDAFDVRNELYGMVLQHLLAKFREASSQHLIGDGALNALEHAVGVANDETVKAYENKDVDFQVLVPLTALAFVHFIVEDLRLL